MKRKFFIIISLLFNFSCSIQHNNLNKKFDRSKATQQLYFHLSNRDLQKAGRYIIFLEGPQTEKESLLFAQFHLMSCNPRMSLKYIEKIMTVEKDLIEGVIAGMVSIDRVSQPIKSANNKKSQLIFPIDDGEIWPDEWRDIGTANGFCKKISLSQKEYRTLLKNYSLEKFNGLPEEVFLRDFSLISLGIDLGYTFKNPHAILKKFKNKKESSYYKYIENIYTQETKENNVKVQENDNEGELVLSIFKTKRDQIEPKKIKIPFVLKENFL